MPAAPVPDDLQDHQLLYVSASWAYFIDGPLELHAGQNWGQAPWEVNATAPPPRDDIVKIAYDGDLYPPGHGPRASYDQLPATNNEHGVSVHDILTEKIPWLVETNYETLYREAGVEILPGTTLARFADLVEKADGTVYTKW